MRKITNEEMERRKLVALAMRRLWDECGKITDATGGLTTLEWITVLLEMQRRYLAIGLEEEREPLGVQGEGRGEAT